MTGASEHFDWNPNGENGGDIIVRHQPAIAIYLNPHGELVIRQEGYYGPDEDQFVFVSAANMLNVAEKMLETAGIDMSVAEPPAERLLLPALKDTTAAERMRRYRNKQRNGYRYAVTEEPELRLVAAE